ncbi:MAG: hypothetical protein U9N59_00925, partial [Campylobacterota bacterium]|nr:hypothetical protein [Campylobacterota bacterium]
TKNIVCAKCVFTIYGYSLPLKRYSASKNKLMQTIEFAGLRKFDEKALYLNKIIQILKNHLINSYIPRIDIALDFLNKLPKWIDNNIKKLRPKIETVKNTIYFMGKKQEYRSSTMDIKCYPKYIKDKLSKKIIRLEFVFKGRYTKGFQYKNIKNLYVKIINTIKKFTGLDVTIKPI